MQPNYKANADIGDRRKVGKDHCFKFGEKGHMAWQCPKMIVGAYVLIAM